MHKTSRALALALLLLLASAGLAVAKHADEIDIKIPPGWKVGNSSEDRLTQTQIMELIRPGDDIHDWKELLTEFSGSTPHGVRKPEEILDRLKTGTEGECPSSTVWIGIGMGEGSITYEWHARTCLGQPEQCEIAKILLGKKTFYSVRYS